MQIWKYLDTSEREKIYETVGRSRVEEWQAFKEGKKEHFEILSARFRERENEDPLGERWDQVATTANSFWKQQYKSYLSSPEWQAKRDLVLHRDNHKCRICGSTKDLHVHHLTYDRVYDESLYDLVAVCEGCHTLIHTLD